MYLKLTVTSSVYHISDTLCLGTKAEDSRGHKGGDLSSLLMPFGQLVAIIRSWYLGGA